MMNGSIDHILWEMSDLIGQRRYTEAAALWQAMQSHPDLPVFRNEIDSYKPALEHVNDFEYHAKALQDESAFWENPRHHASFWATFRIPF